MVENARIILIEDDLDIRNRARQVLSEAGHEVVLEADSFSEVKLAMPRVLEAQVQVAVLDGHLSKKARNCSDGREITQLLAEEAPRVQVVAFTGANRKTANYGQAYVCKSESTEPHWTRELPRVIHEL